MAIKKFIVNDEEAKIDYEGLENKPFGEIVNEEVIYPLKTSDYQSKAGVSMAQLDPSDFTDDIIIGEHYIVEFDGTKYYVEAADNNGDVYLSNINIADFPVGFVFAIQFSSRGIMAMALTPGDHSLLIKHYQLSTLDPSYLPNIFLGCVDADTGDTSITEYPFLEGLFYAITHPDDLVLMRWDDPSA